MPTVALKIIIFPYWQQSSVLKKVLKVQCFIFQKQFYLDACLFLDVWSLVILEKHGVSLF